MRFKNPLAGVMPDTGMKSKGSKFWLILSIIVGIALGGQVASGFALGTMVVFGMMLTIEQFPGFWTLAQNAWGRLLIACLTGYIAHKLIPGEAITVAVATAWATLLKALILAFESKRLKQEKQVKLAGVHARIQRYQKNPPIEAEFVGYES